MRRRHSGDAARFQRLVARALDRLPKQFRDHMENVEVVLVDWPTREELAEAGLEPDEILFGLYEGVPLIERTSGYGMVLPDRITIFRGPIEEACRSDAEIIDEVRITVLHEVGHFFGMTDEELERSGYE